MSGSADNGQVRRRRLATTRVLSGLALPVAVALLTASLATPFRASAETEAEAEALYRELFSSPNGPVPALKCIGKATVLAGVQQPVRLPLEWSAGAEPFFVRVALRGQEEGQPATPWWTWDYGYEDEELTVSRPDGSHSHKGYVGLDEPAWDWSKASSATQRNVSHWLLGAIRVGRSLPDEVRFVPREETHGNPVLEGRWKNPIAKYLGWVVNRVAVEVDMERKLPLRVRWYTPEDALVSETTYDRAEQLSSDRWVWLQWETSIASATISIGGEGTLKIKKPVQKEVRLRPTMVWPKRTVRRTFRLTEDGMVVPARVQVFGEADKLAVDLVIESVERVKGEDR